VKLLLFASGRDSALHSTNQNANATLLKVTQDCLDNLDNVFNVGGTSLNDVLDLHKLGTYVDYAHYLDAFICNFAVWGTLPSGRAELLLGGDGGKRLDPPSTLNVGGGESGLSGSEDLDVPAVEDEERLTQYKRVERLLYQYALDGEDASA